MIFGIKKKYDCVPGIYLFLGDLYKIFCVGVSFLGYPMHKNRIT